jgi:hypothetical protein
MNDRKIGIPFFDLVVMNNQIFENVRKPFSEAEYLAEVDRQIDEFREIGYTEAGSVFNIKQVVKLRKMIDRQREALDKIRNIASQTDMKVEDPLSLILHECDLGLNAEVENK